MTRPPATPPRQFLRRRRCSAGRRRRALGTEPRRDRRAAAASGPATTRRWSASSCTAATTMPTPWSRTTTPNYAAYQAIRPTIATPRETAAATLVPERRAAGGRQFALAPDARGLKALFDAGRLGVLLNVGTLIQPTTKAQYSGEACRCRPSCSRTTTNSRCGRRRCPRARPRAGAGASATCSCANAQRDLHLRVGHRQRGVHVGPARQPVPAQPSGSVRLRPLQRPLFGSPPARTRCARWSPAPRPHLIENE